MFVYVMGINLFLFLANIFKSKKDDDTESPYYRLEEKEQQYSDLQVSYDKIS